MSWKILVTDGLEKNGKDILNEHDEVVDRKGIEADELLQVIPDYHAIIVRGRTKVTAELLEAAKNLKAVGRMGVGVDNIDLKAAQAKGVTVVNCAVATTEAVAELAMGLLYALAREIPRADATMKAGTWAKKEFNGIELKDKTLGILGFGNIGQTTAKYAKAIGMDVIVRATERNAEKVKELGFEAVSMDDLLARADFISLHMPLTPESKYLLNDEAFAKMKDGVRIVDAARGGIVEEAALLRALESGKVAAAALDVFEKEPPLDYALAQHPRVIAVPHIGAQTEEAQLRAAEDISTEILNVLNDQPLRWKIV